jgi:hypothetical protein
MASTPVEAMVGLTGLTLTLQLFPRGVDTIANGAGDAMTEQTNRKGCYRATVTEAITGVHEAYIYEGADLIFTGAVYLLDTTDVFSIGELADIPVSDIGGSVYDAAHDFSRGDSTDQHRVLWYKNGAKQTTVTSPTLSVKDDAGNVLFAPTAMTDLGSGDLRYDATGAERMTIGLSYKALLSATIDGATRTYDVPISRDAIVETFIERIATTVIGNVTGAGTGTEVFVYSGVTATVSVNDDGDRTVVFS